MYSGSLPITRGARGLKPDGTLGIGIIPLSLTSIDTAPFGPGILPDTSAEGRAKHKVIDEEIHEAFFGSAEKTWLKIFEDLGCENITGKALDAVYTYPDRFLQMCTPGVEYPRKDAPSSIGFAGGSPKGHRDPMKEPPKWWDEVVKNPGEKDIVFVCRGTIARNLSDLTFPAMEALKDRENTLVLVALGLKGATFPEGIHVPANVRVADFIPFDECLPHCAVFVTNGGYGALQHGISNGIPLVVAGAGEDKPEVCARAEWAGVAVNLRTGQPTKEALRKAIDEVISNSKYKKATQKLEAEMATFDPMTVITKTIDELAAGKS
jgi:UDP:flavonoid glycosyltransferase YjiC (YdhE family)